MQQRSDIVADSAGNMYSQYRIGLRLTLFVIETNMFFVCCVRCLSMFTLVHKQGVSIV